MCYKALASSEALGWLSNISTASLNSLKDYSKSWTHGVKSDDAVDPIPIANPSTSLT